MKKSLWIAPLLLLPLGAAIAHSQDKQTQEAAMADDPAMARMMEYATPGTHHRVLDARVGKWNAKMKMMMPGSPAEESTGTSTVAWILDGHFLEDTFRGEVMGMPFEGRGLVGYDNLRKTYFSTWIDSMSTGVMQMDGTWDAGKRTFTFTGKFPDWENGGYVKGRMVERWVDKDQYVLESYRPGPDGADFMDMQIHYTRAK